MHPTNVMYLDISTVGSRASRHLRLLPASREIISHAEPRSHGNRDDLDSMVFHHQTKEPSVSHHHHHLHEYFFSSLSLSNCTGWSFSIISLMNNSFRIGSGHHDHHLPNDLQTPFRPLGLGRWIRTDPIWECPSRLAAVNFFLACVGTIQVSRILLYQRSISSDSTSTSTSPAPATSTSPSPSS